MATTLMVVLVVAAVVVAGMAVALAEQRDRRRNQRAELAGQAAVAAHRARLQNPPLPPGLEIHLTDWGAGSDWEAQGKRWRWTVWRSDAGDAASDLVDGVLVPMAMGNAATRHAATLSALGAVSRYQQSTGWDGEVAVSEPARG